MTESVAESVTDSIRSVRGGIPNERTDELTNSRGHLSDQSRLCDAREIRAGFIDGGGTA